MMKPVVDVIIPLYNGEKFITQLIETLQDQTFKDFKAIFVDDGSTDNSLKLLQEELKDAKFESKVICQKNGGASKARNTGIKNSTAQWITFVDCDDKLDPHFLEYLYRSVTENNTVLGYCGFQGIPSDQSIEARPAGEYNCDVISSSECMKNFYTTWISPCCLMFDREWFLSNNLFFDEECTYCEDIPFITGLIEAAKTVSKIENSPYIYLQREGSSIRSPRMDKYKNGIDGFLRLSEKLDKKESDAAKVFRNMGKARYMIATLRKGAVQLNFKDFKALTQWVNLDAFKWQIKNLSGMQKAAGYLYLISKTLFYCSIRLLFKD